ncbi:MAG: SH3 domain-containing protein, partial [Acidobacteriota bacterium]|nr:SH3 domain-containing protein [Acidobacteriota bacterium]
MRRLPVGLNWALRVVASGGLVLFIAAAAARSQDSGSRLPVEVQSVEMSEASAGEDIVIEAASPVDWIADLEPDGSLVVFLSGSVPGPEALDLSSANGLVSTVGVGFTVVGGVPTTRLAIRTRSSFRYRVVEAGRRLTVEMRPDDQGTPAPTPLPPAETRSVETQPPAESGSRGLRDELLRVRAQAALLERELSTSRGDLEEARRARQSLEARLQEADRQSETYRERASSLHADRLRLIEELRESRAEVAHGVSTDVVAEATEDAERRLAESERAVRGAQEEVTELRRRLEQVESSATASSGTEKRMREELEQLRGELAASRSSEERLRSELATTRSDLERTTGERSLADQAIANDAGDRAVSDALRRSLEESRSSESDLRRWLARAPALLGIESLVVGDAAAPCLSFRPAPSTDSPVLDCIEPGTVLSALMMRPDWMRVRLPDRREGWVSQQYLEPAYKSEMAEL